jgi:hypothetical protein
MRETSGRSGSEELGINNKTYKKELASKKINKTS